MFSLGEERIVVSYLSTAASKRSRLCKFRVGRGGFESRSRDFLWRGADSSNLLEHRSHKKSPEIGQIRPVQPEILAFHEF